jgi:virulence factor Mce-like protein
MTRTWRHVRPAVVAGAVLAALALGGCGGGQEIQAEFSDANGLVPGNDVRVNGAPAGTVSSMKLTDRGTALVTMELHDGLAPPRADATAAIRPVDLIGDNYVALSPGSAADPLNGPIPPSRTLDAPRLDDLLRAVGDPQRAGLRAMLVEGGIALDDRGVDLNQAALALRPTLQAADRVAQELGSQNADLGRFVADAERVASQAASHNRELGGLVDSVDATLHATADNAGSLDAALGELPSTLGDLQTTAAKLESTANAAMPLAASLRDSAPGLAGAAAKLGPFLDSASTTADELDPVIRRATSVLSGGEGTFAAARHGLTRLEAVSPAVDRFMRVLDPAAPSIAKGFFVNFPDQAAEPGNQPFDPFADPRRHYWRGAAVLTCQSFGEPIEPGCLQRFLHMPAPSEHGGDHRSGGGDRKRGSDAGSTPAAPSPPTGPAPRHLHLPVPGGAGRSLPGVPGLGGGSRGHRHGHGEGAVGTGRDLLNLLFGP